jgi:hypothetical protein
VFPRVVEMVEARKNRVIYGAVALQGAGESRDEGAIENAFEYVVEFVYVN